MCSSITIENENLIISDEFRKDFRSLIEKVDDLVRVSILKPLTGGFSESVPLLVYAEYKNNTRTYQVFKIGKKDIIAAEAKNWNEFIKNGPYNHSNVIHLKGGPFLLSSHSLIVYNFVGQITNDPTTFENFYVDKRNPENALKSLFEEILQPLTDRIRKGQDHPQISKIFEIDKNSRDQITHNVKELLGSNRIYTVPKIRILGKEIYNPLYFYPFDNNSLQPKNIAIPIPMGIIHGDLNARNILFYKTRTFAGIKEELIPCIIDYAHTEIGFLYADIAKLESVLKFQLLDVDRIDYNKLLQFEQENVLHCLDPSDDSNIQDPHLQKLFSSINTLRQIASKIVGKDYDPVGYWLELYRNTLLHIKYSDTSDSKKKYAFISAALILTKHLVNEKETTVFKIPEKVKYSRDVIEFSLEPLPLKGINKSEPSPLPLEMVIERKHVILMALRVEYMAVRAHLTDIKKIKDQIGIIYEQGIFTYNGESLKVAIAEIGHGNVNAAQRTEMAIQYFNPNIILFVGVAGGIKDVKLGDVVAATKVYGYEYGKADATFKPRPESYLSTYSMIERAKAEARKEDWLRHLKNNFDSKPCVYIGPIASGEKVLASHKASLYKFIKSNYNDTLAIEMEGYGFLEAVHSHHQKVNALVIRGISDLIENKEESDKSSFQEIALQHASAFAFEILAKTAQPLEKIIKNYK